MESVLKQELETVPEPLVVSHFTSHGLLNSNYQSVVKKNFCTFTKNSVFGIRQGLKAFQFKTINHTAAILKLSVFAIFLISIF